MRDFRRNAYDTATRLSLTATRPRPVIAAAADVRAWWAKAQRYLTPSVGALCCVLLSAAAGCSSDSDDGDMENEAPGGQTSELTCVVDTSGEFGDPGQTALRVDVVADGLNIPWGLDWLPDGAILVTERGGTIRRIDVAGQLQEAPVATVAISPSGEGGLLGIALHPEVATNGWLYVYATVGQTGALRNEVQRWVLNDAQTAATFESVIVSDIPALLYHNGGRIRFGPEGYLYIGTGDAGVPGLSQDVSSLAGKLLRVTDEGEVPADNPFPGQAAYLTGVRNTQGFDWRDNGAIVLTDHGPSGLPVESGRTDYDEINVASPGDNLGWPDVYRCETQAGMVAPSKTWARAMPPGRHSHLHRHQLTVARGRAHRRARVRRGRRAPASNLVGQRRKRDLVRDLPSQRRRLRPPSRCRNGAGRPPLRHDQQLRRPRGLRGRRPHPPHLGRALASGEVRLARARRRRAVVDSLI